MTWRAKFSVGGWIGLLAIGVIAGIDLLLLRLLIGQSIREQQINFITFLMGLIVLLSIPALVLAIYHTVSLVTLRYKLDRNGLSVRWWGSEQIIPIRDIQRIISGSEFGGSVVRRRGLHWPGYEYGMGMVPGVGRTRFLASQPLAGQLLLVTPGVAYGISPSDTDQFVKAFESRQAVGPNRLLEQQLRRAPWITWHLWSDSTAWGLLGAALAINLILFGFLTARFPNIDPQLPLHFNSLGQADRISAKMELFDLPVIGLLILGANLVLGLLIYRRERAGAYLLWGGAAAVQALFWLAATSLLP